jgi:predicted membrane channel-forming protein YqfA (hemolysin III family)
MEVFLTRPMVIGLAIAGALFSLAASVLQKRGVVTEARANRLNTVGYALMGVSMLLFVVVGLRGGTA